MPKILYADNDYADIDLERALFGQAGIEMIVAQCKTEEQIIEDGRGCRGPGALAAAAL